MITNSMLIKRYKHFLIFIRFFYYLLKKFVNICQETNTRLLTKDFFIIY